MRSLLIPLALTAAASASLERRVILPNGGWALMTNGSCSVGNSAINSSGLQGCCPTLEKQEDSSGPGSHVCCPSGSSCLSALQSTPYCARAEWVLWNSTTQSQGNGYFCCDDKETGMNDMTCSSGTVPSSQAANRLGRPLPTGVTLTGTTTGSISGSSSAATVAATVSTTSSTSASALTSSTSTSSSGSSPTQLGAALPEALGMIGAAFAFIL